MSDKLLKAPTFSCDSGPSPSQDPAPAKAPPADVAASRQVAAASKSLSDAPRRMGGLPMASSGVGAALARDEVDAAWRDLLRACASAGLPLLRVVEEQAEALVQQGVPSAIVHRLTHGYPAAPLRMGTLIFFPPLAMLFEARRFPSHFYVAEAYEGEHVFKRRVRQSLVDGGADGDVTDEELDGALIAAATRYIDAFGARPAMAQDASAQNLKHWLPGAEDALNKAKAEGEGAPAHVALLGPLMSWEDYRSELERRLMVARLWCLLGVVAAVGAFSRSGALSSRLLLAFGALGILGGGLGLAPWMRATARLRELVAADPTRRDAPDLTS
ncbi:MAG: hypothetical protein AB8H86_06495 [Polyangiales bacterium]